MITTLLMAFLVGCLNLFRLKQKRRIAEARLELSKVIIEWEHLMLKGLILKGQVAHDHTFRALTIAERSTDWSIWWNFWTPPSSAVMERRRALHVELQSNQKLNNLLCLSIRARFKAFANRHPFKAIAFSLYVMLFAGGLSVLINGLKGMIAVREAWRAYRQMICEMFASYNSEKAQLC